MTREQPSEQLKEVVALLVRALAIADESHCTLVAAHIEMAIAAARNESGIAGHDD
ncbi:hypothetical protein FHT00_002894 [Sphingomonas insulae]|uniref:Uncharacterized protein n=1 Tax=Sphingomonas insulae TaxID=424800 RepID=A0ABP3SRF0_9SPHN|nr:hypothetical protein [Sphingomonas insulae]NIJ30921.1 hypothetical protein [Sphingomonas insulae]